MDTNKRGVVKNEAKFFYRLEAYLLQLLTPVSFYVIVMTVMESSSTNFNVLRIVRLAGLIALVVLTRDLSLYLLDKVLNRILKAKVAFYKKYVQHYVRLTLMFMYFGLYYPFYNASLEWMELYSLLIFLWAVFMFVETVLSFRENTSETEKKETR